MLSLWMCFTISLDQSSGAYCSSPTYNSSPQPYYPLPQQSTDYCSGYAYPTYSDCPTYPWYPVYSGTSGYTSPGI